MGAGSSLVGRIGMLHTVTIDYEELYWPRYLQQVGLEKNGFFSSSDVGIAGLATLGNRWGEIYGLVDNGPGYTSYDNPGTTGQPVTSNRFKDVGLRVSLTPFANDPTKNHYIRYLSISPWGYLGYNGSAFQSGGAGQVGPGTNGAITDRVMAAMEAADASGGDSRCSCPPPPADGSTPAIACEGKTAHIAYILMAEKTDTPIEADANGAFKHNNGNYAMYLTVNQPAQGGAQAIKPGENLNPVKTLRMRYDVWRKLQPASFK